MSDEAPYGWLVLKPAGFDRFTVVGYVKPDEPLPAPEAIPAEGALAPLPGWLNVKRGLVDYIAMRERREVYRREDR